MDLKNVFAKIQYALDWMADSLEPIENRWLVFIITVAIMLLLKAGGAHGLALIVALVYVMYFVTLRR